MRWNVKEVAIILKVAVLASLYEKPLYSLGESEENNEKSQDIRQPT
jgi:hypothetical protein